MTSKVSKFNTGGSLFLLELVEYREYHYWIYCKQVESRPKSISPETSVAKLNWLTAPPTKADAQSLEK